MFLGSGNGQARVKGDIEITIFDRQVQGFFMRTAGNEKAESHRR